MKTSDSITHLAAALSKAQAIMPAAPKDAKNDHLRNTYATLGSIIATAQPILAQHGLAFVQMIEASEPGTMALTTRIMHESGEWLEATMTASIPQSKLSEIQAAGSVASYMRRYSLASALGIMTEDDDGQAASQPTRTQQKAQPTAPRPQSPAAPAQAAVGKLSADAAQRLHKQLGAMLTDTPYREMTHNAFAAGVIGRDVGSLTDLTPAEAKEVYSAAQVAQQEAQAA